MTTSKNNRSLVCLRAVALLFGTFFVAVLPVRAANDWTYYAANAAGNPTNVACIVKGDWIVEVDIMTLNKGMFSPKHILASASDGILDFRDLHIDGTAITDMNIRQGNLWQDANVVEFYANHVTTFNEIFGRSTANSRIVHLASDTLTTIGSRYVSLTNLVFNYPNATTWSAQFHNCSLTNDVSEIVPPYIQKFTTSPGNLGAGVIGELVLTNLCELSDQVGCLFPAGVPSGRIKFTGTTLNGQPFRMPTPNALRDVELIATNATEITYRYVMNVGVTNMVLDIPNVTSVGSDARLPIPTDAKSSVWFYNAPNYPTVVTNLLKNVTAVASNKNQDKYCTIYCSKKQGWAALAAPLEGDYENALAPAGCFGVLVNNKGRAAWMVHRASPYDKSGLAIFVR